ncbi:MAG: hypothetical protein FJY51_05185 [Betaproteobacteria bacterium]|nr:hypothetical protein [Betaproteobacteria bacterium]
MSLNISMLLDGQLSPEEARTTLGEVAVEALPRDRYSVYVLIGDALRGNSTPDDGFSVRIIERLRRDGAAIEKSFDPLKEF